MKHKHFVLPSDAFLSEIRDLDQKVVIVSIFGKTSAENTKIPHAVDKLLEAHLHQSEDTFTDDSFENNDQVACFIEGWYNENENVIYLNLKGPFDVQILFGALEMMSNDLKDEGFLPVWSRLKLQYARALMLLFSISHIIILCYPSHCLDLSCMQLLKALCYIRTKYQIIVSNILKNLDLESEEWTQHGRLCSPRILFLFTQCPEGISQEVGYKKMQRIKKLEHALEDQIYLVLRKIRLVKNICDRACFSIAPNDEFVYVYCNEDPINDLSLISSLIDDCKYNESSDSEKSDADEGSDADSLESSNNSDNQLCGKGSDSEDTDAEICYNKKLSHSFKEFVMNHVHTAHQKGFFDNMGKYAVAKPFFLLPSILDWFKTANYVLCEPDIGLYSINLGAQLQMEKLMNIELRFSNSRCAKVIPLAIVAYQENLPTHYTAKFHKDKVDHAISVFTRQARGPKMSKFIHQLKEECERFWKSGRQMCEVLSLTGNPCTKPMHVAPNSHQSCQPGETEHWSGVRYVSSCSCGVRQGTRHDPFTIRAANFEFYKTIGKECGCAGLDRINFPVFQPSIHNFRAAELLNITPHAVTGLQNNANELRVNNGSVQTLSIAKLWVPENSALGMISVTPPSNLTDNIHLVLHSDHPVRPLIRQASTTEYLPSMLHTESPIGLLPQFPSWSLICRGPSSLYSHNIGLQDQPGFIAGSAYLLPWDVTIRQKERCWPSISETPRRIQNIGRGTGYRKYRGPRDLFSVKIFVGVEYECLRGHRFMSSGPGKVLKATGNGLVKENATKITKGSMPLFLPCPCGKAISQLMRVHIVTPKAPVFVTVSPRVRPAPPPCPIFVTGCQKPTPLSQSAYWVLRLPYVYAGEMDTYKVPEDPTLLTYGELLGPMYGITETK